MSDVPPLFPFPPAPPENHDHEKAGQPETLPPFPILGTEPHGETAFTPDEVRDLKQVAALFRAGTLAPVAGHGEAVGHGFPAAPQDVSAGAITPPPTPLPKPISMPTPVAPPSEQGFHKSILDFFAALPGCSAQENEVRQQLLTHLKEIDDPALLLGVTGHLAGLFPLRESLRHGTPDQKLFALIALGDRFLQGMAGLVFPRRQAVLKAVAAHLSEVSESTTFLTMEGEPFNPQFHERIPGASASGRVIREMRGFLVIRRGTNQVMRLGRAWT